MDEGTYCPCGHVEDGDEHACPITHARLKAEIERLIRQREGYRDALGRIHSKVDRIAEERDAAERKLGVAQEEIERLGHELNEVHEDRNVQLEAKYKLIVERDLWKERHDRERAAHAANLTRQQKVEAERDRLRNIESRLDTAICLHLPVDPNGPGDCTDRLVAAVELAAQTMRENERYTRELEEERKRLALERDIALAGMETANRGHNEIGIVCDTLRAALQEVRRCLPGTLRGIPALWKQVEQALSGEPAAVTSSPTPVGHDETDVRSANEMTAAALDCSTGLGGVTLEQMAENIKLGVDPYRSPRNETH